jgi:ABC-2 type transport system ATP-binding protein
MVRVENLRKRFGEIRAVDGISFEIRRGEIYGLLGPNGAGKTTTLGMLAGLVAPDEGRILYEGRELAADPLAVKRRLGVVPQEIALYEELTARENLRFWGGMYDLERRELARAIDEVLERVGLAPRADDAVKTFSGGMKRRLNLSLGIVHRPKVVLMDEPTAGIDPQARQNVLDVVRGLARDGTTVLYTTHYLEEAEQLCDRIAIVDHGKLLAEGTLGELTRRVGEGDVLTVQGRFDEAGARERLAAIDSARVIGAEPGRVVLAATGDRRGTVALLSQLLDGGLEVEGISIQPPSLSGLFLKLTGRELRD